MARIDAQGFLDHALGRAPINLQKVLTSFSKGITQYGAGPATTLIQAIGVPQGFQTFFNALLGIEFLAMRHKRSHPTLELHARRGLFFQFG
jgi:hypothetical protein